MAEPQPIRRFAVEPEEAPVQSPSPISQAAQSAAQQMILLALNTLGQRFIVALDGMFLLITVCLVFWYAMSTLPEPTDKQLIGLATFAAFVLIANVIHLRRRK